MQRLFGTPSLSATAAYGMGMQGPAMVNGQFYTQPQGFSLGSLLPYGMAGMGGYAAGNMMGVGNNSWQSGLGGFAGGIGGYFGGAALSPLIAMGLSTFAASAGGAATIGALVGTVVPVLGTIVGGLIGTFIGSLFGGGDDNKDKIPRFMMSYKTPAPDFKYGKPNQYGDWWFSQGGEGDSKMFDEAFRKNMVDTFDKIRTHLMDFVEGIGGDLSKFDEAWKSKTYKIKSEADAKKAIQDMIASFASFYTDIDFTKFQKSGEDITDTIIRIIGAIESVPDIQKSIDEWINAMQNSTDSAATIKDKMTDARNNIKDLWDAYADLTDPADQIGKLNEIKNAEIQYYNDIKSLVQGLADTIDQAKISLMQFTFDLDSKIAELRGNVSDSVGIALDKINYIFDKIGEYASSGDIANALKWVNQAGGAIDQWLTATIAQIQTQYQLQEEANKEAIEAIEKQIDLVKKWQDLLDDVNKTIYDLTTTGANPQNPLERLGIAKGEVERIMALYRASSGEEKLGYAQQLASLLPGLLDLAESAGENLADYQRPGSGYKSIYDYVMAGLEEIQSDAQDQADTAEELQERLAVLNQEQVDLQNENNATTSAMNQAIQDAKNQAAEWYEWIKEQGIPLYDQSILDLQNALAAVIGDMSPSEYLANAQGTAIDALQEISNMLGSIVTDFIGTNDSGTGEGTGGGDNSGGGNENTGSEGNPYKPGTWLWKVWERTHQAEGLAEGGYFTKPTTILTKIAEAGDPEWVLPERKLIGLIREASTIPTGRSSTTMGDIHIHNKFDFKEAGGNITAKDLMKAARDQFEHDLDFDTRIKRKIRKIAGVKGV